MQIYGDPEAADVVFTCGADITVVGINITTQLKLTGEDNFSPTLYLLLKHSLKAKCLFCLFPMFKMMTS